MSDQKTNMVKLQNVSASVLFQLTFKVKVINAKDTKDKIVYKLMKDKLFLLNIFSAQNPFQYYFF